MGMVHGRMDGRPGAAGDRRRIEAQEKVRLAQQPTATATGQPPPSVTSSFAGRKYMTTTSRR